MQLTPSNASWMAQQKVLMLRQPNLRSGERDLGLQRMSGSRRFGRKEPSTKASLSATIRRRKYFRARRSPPFNIRGIKYLQLTINRAQVQKKIIYRLTLIYRLTGLLKLELIYRLSFSSFKKLHCTNYNAQTCSVNCYFFFDILKALLRTRIGSVIVCDLFLLNIS